MKLAVAGKGGVGKTTIAATISRLLGRAGVKTLAIDADPAMNLAAALGVPKHVASSIIPISDNPDLIEDRTGARPGDANGSVFSLTPRVDDLAERFGLAGPDNTELLVMGTVKSAGSGCMCPANALLRALVRHILLQKGEAVVMDMEAGLEHLGRGVVRDFDAIMIVLEPRPSSVQVYLNIVKLAGEMGIQRILPVGNKISDLAEEEFLRHEVEASGQKLLGAIPYDPNIVKAEMAGAALLDFAPEAPSVRVIENLKDTLFLRYGA